MAMDQQRSRQQYWSLWVEGDKEQTVAPGPNERLYVTGASLVGGEGVADVSVVIDKPCGADCVPLASLSAANPCVQESVVVREGEECSLFVMPQGGPAVVRFDGYVVALPPAPLEEEENRDEKAGSSELDHDSRDDGEVEGLAAVSASDEEEMEEETSSSEDDEVEEEEASSSEDDEGYQEEESDGDVGGHAATESSAGGGNTLLHRRSRNFVPEALVRPVGVLAPQFALDRELVQQVAAGAFIGFSVFIYLVAFFKVMISIHLGT